MHLADGGGRERLALERSETSPVGPPSSRDTISRTCVVGKRANLVQELEQLVAIGGRQQVETHGEHLAELDPRSTESSSASRMRSGPPARSPLSVRGPPPSFGASQ